jgi:sortase A
VARRALLTTVVAVTAMAFPVVRGPAAQAAHGESTRVAARSALSAWQAGTVTVEEAATLAIVSDGRPRLARLSIPSLGLRDLRVVPYRGWTDDGPGTDIQDRGVAASPHGPRGGGGPGWARQLPDHRAPTSSTAAFRMLPSLRMASRRS